MRYDHPIRHETPQAAPMLAGPGQAIRLARESGYFGGRAPGAVRFVQQSHVLSAPLATPRSLLIVATIAFALYYLGRRLSD